MLRAVVLLVALFWAASSWAAVPCTLTWNANAEPDLAGYKIYSSATSGVYGTAEQTVGKVTQADCSRTGDGTTRFFTITAIDTVGNESARSGEVSKLFPLEVVPLPARVENVTTNTTGATITIVGPAQQLDFTIDGSTWRSVPGFVANTATVQHATTWADGFVCYRARGTDGLLTEQACAPTVAPAPVDTDGDGIADPLDKCPTVAGIAPDGCPDVPPAPPGGLKITKQTPDQVIVEATKRDCPNGLVTVTTGSNTTIWRRTVTCKR